MLKDVIARFEQHAPISVMARVALEHAITPEWVDAVFEANRQQQYARELLFSTVVELMSLVALGLRPSLHAAAQKADNLPVSLAALYDKVNPTEPAVLRALVQGSAQRLTPVMDERARPAILPGWRLRLVDGNHLPASEDAYTQERAAMAPLVARAEPGELWIADRNFCTRTLRQGWQKGQAHFLVRPDRDR